LFKSIVDNYVLVTMNNKIKGSMIPTNLGYCSETSLSVGKLRGSIIFNVSFTDMKYSKTPYHTIYIKYK